jgi:hypothetical protein
VATTHIERDSTRPESARLLLRRLLITCPVTGLPTDTGFELSAVPQVSRTRQVLVDCLECGQDHAWGIEDAVLDGRAASLTLDLIGEPHQ